MHISTLRAAAIIALAGVSPAHAQKSADTLRVPYVDPISTVLVYDDTKPETIMTSDGIFDGLICYDRKEATFVPELAKSWRQVDPKTVEFQLRDDVTFHDGTRFTAADVVYTLNWIIDPASKLRFAPINFGWLDHAEQVDEHTVRVVAKEPTPLLMIRLVTPILPAKLHGSYQNKSDFGRKTPVGTGPYKVASFDSSTGVELVRNPDDHHASPCKPAPRIGRVHIVPMPDKQTQLAQLSVGGIDLVHAQSKDEADFLAASPMLETSTFAGVGLQFLIIDAVSRSGVAALADQRVRRAIVQAIDRQLVARSVLPGGDAVVVADALCTRDQLGCDYSVRPPPYDLAAAKKLLADAGYENGFAAQLTALPGSYEIAAAVSGELRKVGIFATVDKATFVAFRQKQSEGKESLASAWWPTATALDASSLVSYLFDDTPRNYTHDAKIAELAQKGLSTVDPAERKAIYRQLFDRVNEMSYVIPIASVPDVVVHGKDLAIDKDPVHATGFEFVDMSWK